MRRSLHFIPEKLQFEQLRHSYFERLSYSAKPRIPRSLTRAGDLFKKVGAERVRCSSKVAIWLSQKLGNQVEVPDQLKEFGKLSKLSIDVHLFEVRLMQAVGVFFVLWQRPLDQHPS